MNGQLNQGSPTPEPTIESLEKQLQALRKLFVVALVILLVASGSVMIFLWGQKRILNSQMRDVRKYLEDYETVTAPFIGNFVSNLQAFGQSHPDFNPILDKYKLRQTASNAPSMLIPALGQGTGSKSKEPQATSK